VDPVFTCNKCSFYLSSIPQTCCPVEHNLFDRLRSLGVFELSGHGRFHFFLFALRQVVVFICPLPQCVVELAPHIPIYTILGKRVALCNEGTLDSFDLIFLHELRIHKDLVYFQKGWGSLAESFFKRSSTVVIPSLFLANSIVVSTATPLHNTGTGLPCSQYVS